MNKSNTSYISHATIININYLNSTINWISMNRWVLIPIVKTHKLWRRSSNAIKSTGYKQMHSKCHHKFNLKRKATHRLESSEGMRFTENVFNVLWKAGLVLLRYHEIIRDTVKWIGYSIGFKKWFLVCKYISFLSIPLLRGFVVVMSQKYIYGARNKIA